MSLQALPKFSEVGVVSAIGGGVAGVASLLTTTPLSAAFPFGCAAAGVGWVAIYLFKVEDESDHRLIIRVAFAIFAGIAAGMAAGTLGGYLITLDIAFELIAVACGVSVAALYTLTQA